MTTNQLTNSNEYKNMHSVFILAQIQRKCKRGRKNVYLIYDKITLKV